MSTENKNIVRRLYDEVWNKRKLDVVDELISPTHALLDPFVSGSQVGPQLYRRRVVDLTSSFPDLRFSLDDIIAEKEKVVVSWVISRNPQGRVHEYCALRQKSYRRRDHHSLHSGRQDSRLQCSMGCPGFAATARSPSAPWPEQGSYFWSLNLQ